MAASRSRRDLLARLDELVRTPVLLVAADFDGTLAPIVTDPNAARAEPRALDALHALARLPRTHVAILSGRALADLAPRVQGPAPLRLVGSHGGEVAPTGLPPLTPEQRARLAQITAIARRHAESTPGSLLETKPAGVTFHYRTSEPEAARHALAALRAEVESLPGLRQRDAKLALELSVIDVDKGQALARLRIELGATGTVMLGDDATDEDAFGVLGPSDLSIKVGEGATAAGFRIPGQADVVELLVRVRAARASFKD